MKKLLSIIFLLLAACTAYGYGACRQNAAAPAQAEQNPTLVTPEANNLHFVRVVQVIDGSTIEVTFYNGAIPERVRLIGVDTPEVDLPQLDFTKMSLKNRYVWLQFDVEPRDRYQRLLGYIWTEKPYDVDNKEEIRDKMFNARLILNGYAQAMTIQPNSRYAELFLEFQRQARACPR